MDHQYETYRAVSLILLVYFFVPNKHIFNIELGREQQDILESIFQVKRL